jgi:hypothetical protein
MQGDVDDGLGQIHLVSDELLASSLPAVRCILILQQRLGLLQDGVELRDVVHEAVAFQFDEVPHVVVIDERVGPDRRRSQQGRLRHHRLRVGNEEASLGQGVMEQRRVEVERTRVEAVEVEVVALVGHEHRRVFAQPLDQCPPALGCEAAVTDVVVRAERVEPEDGERLVVVEVEFRPDVPGGFVDVGVEVRCLLEPPEPVVFGSEVLAERVRGQDRVREGPREAVIQGRGFGVEDQHRRRPGEQSGVGRVRAHAEDQVRIESSRLPCDVEVVPGKLPEQRPLGRIALPVHAVGDIVVLQQ